MKRTRCFTLLLCVLLARPAVAQDRTQERPLDSRRTGFAPAVVRFPNLAPQDAKEWASLFGPATVTTGIAAPDGTSEAAILSIAGTPTGFKRLHGATTTTVGLDDWIIAGVWVKAVSRQSGLGNLAGLGNLTSRSAITLSGETVATVTLGGDAAGYKLDGDGLNYRDLRANGIGDTEWEWVTMAAKVAAAPTGNQARLQFDLRCADDRPLAFFAPILMHVPSGRLTDDEATNLLQNLYAVPENVSPGVVATLKGQSFQSKLRDAGGAALDVRALGAKADGVTDDLLPLQKAIAATAGTGVPVLLPAGTTRLSATVRIPGGVTLKGAGYKKTVLRSEANAVIVEATRGDGANQFTGPIIRDLAIVGSKSAGGNQIGLRVDDDLYLAEAEVTGVRISQAGSHGLYVGKAFSSRFVDIHSGDNNGYPFLINSPNMPANHYESLYAQDVNAPYSAGFRVRAGDVHCIACNGINASPTNSWWAVVGDKTGVDGATANRSAYFECWNCNIESSKAGGVLNYSNSVFAPKGRTLFAGDAGAAGSYVALKYEVDALLYPPYFAKGKIDDSVTFANSAFAAMTGLVSTVAGSPVLTGRGTRFLSQFAPGELLMVGANAYKIASITNNTSLTLTTNAAATVNDFGAGKAFYAEGQPIHANDLPPLLLDGQGPKIAGGQPQTGYYNTTRGRAEMLYRADGYAPRLELTTSTTLVNPGARNLEINCPSDCTITLPWPGWYNVQEPVYVKNKSATGVKVTLMAGSGGTVNGVGSLEMRRRDAGVVLLPFGDGVSTADYRTLGETTKGGASELMINAGDYGARCDGVSDDTAAIAQGIAAAQAGNRIFSVPPGVCLTDPITVNLQRLTIRGAGKGKSTLKARQSNKPVFALTGAGHASGLVIEDLTVQGAGKSSGAAGHGIYINDPVGYLSEFNLRRLEIKDCGGNGIYVPTAFTGVIDSVSTDEIGGNHFDIAAGNTVTLLNNYVHTVEAGKVGYRISGGQANLINNNGMEPDSALSARWGLFGSEKAEDGADLYFRAMLYGNNIEDFGAVGLEFKVGSFASFFSNQFSTGKIGNHVAVKFRYLENLLGGWDTASNRLNPPSAGAWLNGWPVHSFNPPFLVTGQDAQLTNYYDTQAGAVRPLAYLFGQFDRVESKTPVGSPFLHARELLKLGEAGATTGSLKLMNSGNANATVLEAGNNAPALKYVLPTAVPAAGQVLAATTLASGDVSLNWVGARELSGVLWRSTSVSAFDTTTAATSLLANAGIGSKTLGAGRLAVGSQLRIKAGGSFSTKAANAGTFTLTIINGPITMATVGPFKLPDNVTNSNWWLEALGTLSLTGTNGAIRWTVQFNYNDGADNLKTASYAVNSTTFNTTLPRALDLRGKFSVNDPANYWQTNIADIEVLP